MLFKLSIDLWQPLPYLNILLEKGVDVTPINEQFGSMILAAVQVNDTNLLKYILEKYPNQNANIKLDGKTALHYAIEKGNYENVLLLYELGANPAITDKNGKTAFDLAKDGDIAKFFDLFKKAKADTKEHCAGDC